MDPSLYANIFFSSQVCYCGVIKFGSVSSFIIKNMEIYYCLHAASKFIKSGAI